MNITDKMLQEAAAKVSIAMLYSLPEPENCHYSFSPRFHRKMRKLLRTGKKNSVLRCVAAAVLAILIGASCWLGVDKGTRAAFISWVRAQCENTFVYRFFGSDRNTDLPVYTLGWLPEGYVEIRRVQEDTQILCTYSGPDGGTLYFDYIRMSDGVLSAVTTNGIEPESVIINGLEGDFYLSATTLETNELIWFDQEANISFALSSYFDKTVMIHIAKSIFLETPTN